MIQNYKNFSMMQQKLFLILLIYYCSITCYIPAAVAQSTCSNEEIEFAELEKNATNEARLQLLSTVLSEASQNAFGGINLTSYGGGAVDTNTLYSIMASNFNVTESDERRQDFTAAMNTITDSYFKSCYGPLEERPTSSDAQELITELVNLLINQTGYDQVRQIYGKLMCLGNFTANSTTSATTLKRQASDLLLQCSHEKNIRDLYNCLDENNQIPCIFHVRVCMFYSSTASGSSIFKRNCLAFVVDTTGSMGDEINAVKEILTKFIQSEENTLTLCYVLVAFNDFGNTLNLENNLEFARVYSASQVDGDKTAAEFTVHDENNNNISVRTIDDLLLDVNSLQANGGGDCPEYGMIGIKKAIELLRGVQPADIDYNRWTPYHNIVVLTDASAKDDQIANSIIKDLKQYNYNHHHITIHMFYSGGGCHNGFGNYSSIAAATEGHTVTQIDAAAFPEFVQFIQDSAGARKRRSTSTSTCQSFVISQFITEYTALIETDQSTVNIISPNGTSMSLSKPGKSFTIHSVSNPQAGEWEACLTTSVGDIEVSLNTKVSLDFSVTYLEEGYSGQGQLLPSNNVPFVCESKLFTIRVVQEQFVSLNHSLFLDFIDVNKQILSSAEITSCNGVLRGVMDTPSEANVQYQLRGYDSIGNPFTHQGEFITLQDAVNGLTATSPHDIIVNPSEPSTVRLLITNILHQPFHNVSLYLYVPLEFNLTAQNAINFDLLLPQESKALEFTLAAFHASLIEGSPFFNIVLSIDDYCQITNVTFPASILPSIPINVTDKTTRSLTFTWSQPLENISEYILSFEVDSPSPSPSSITLVTVDNTILTYTLDKLTPYQLVYYSIRANDANGTTIAWNSLQSIWTDESIPSKVEGLQVDVLSSTSAELSWSEPADKNGVLLYYEVTVIGSDGYNKQIITNTINEGITLVDLMQFVHYEVEVRAATIAGKSQPSTKEFYTVQGVPSGPLSYDVISISDDSVQITWAPPLIQDRMGFIIGYYIELIKYSNESSTEIVEATTVDSDTFIYTPSGLEPYQRYEVLVCGQTSAGQGKKVSKVFFAKEGAPLVSPSLFNYTLISSTSFLVSWEPPAFNQRRGFLTKYTVRIVQIFPTQQRETRSSEDHSYVLSPNATQLGLKGLTMFGVYSASVTAATSVGEGPFANITVYIVTGVPSVPTNASGTAINSTAVQLEWRYPEEENGFIDKFVISYGIKNTYSNESVQSVYHLRAPSNKSISINTVIANLKEGGTYLFKIAAHNPAGIGDEVNVSVLLPESSGAKERVSDTEAITTSVSVVIVIIISVVIVITVFILLMIFKRKKQTKAKLRLEIPMEVKQEKKATVQ